MSHDPHLLYPATTENSYLADERWPDRTSTIHHDDDSQTHTRTWPSSAPSVGLTYPCDTDSSLDLPSQHQYSACNFSSIDSYGGVVNSERERLEDWSNAASQPGSLVDATSGTHESRGYLTGHSPTLEPGEPVCMDSCDYSRTCEFDEPGGVDSCDYVTYHIPPWEPLERQELEHLDPPSLDSHMTNANHEPSPWLGYYHASDQSYAPAYTYQGEDSSGPPLYIGESDLDRMLIQSSPADISESGTQLGTQSHHSASVPAAMRCPHCNALFTGRHRSGNLGRHVRQKHKKTREYVCEEMWCDRVFLRADARLKHYRRRHPGLVRDTVASQPDDGRNRREYHTNGTDGNSDKDLGLANTMSAMSSREKHSNVDSASSMLTTLTRGPSVETTHKTEESLQCSDCHKTFNRLADLRRHKAAVHDPDPPQYACPMPLCVRACRPFTRKDKLNDHMAKVHGPSTAVTPRKPTTFACPEQGCGREFDQRADLLRHQRTHTDMSERPHKCGQCDKSFLYPKDLKRHEATHLGDEDEEKPSFHCPVTSCEYGPGGSGFSRKDGMLRHMKRFHPEWKE